MSKKEKKQKPVKEKINKKELANKRKEDKLKQKELQKQELQRKKDALVEENAPVSWTYAHDADLTIGEKKISNVAKVILILLLAGLVTGGVFAYLNRYYIIDYISKPEIALTTNKIVLEVGDEFNYADYVVKKEYPDRYTLEFPNNDSVDTSTLGEYSVTYKLQTLANNNEANLLVEVVDTTSPKIELTENIIQLERGEQTEKFDPQKYIKSVKDNYDSKKDIKVEYTKTFDFTQDEVVVSYTATDKSGNIGKSELTIIVNDPPKEPEIVYVEKEVTPTPTPEPTPQPQQQTQPSGGSQEYYEPQPTPAPTPAPTPQPQPQQPAPQSSEPRIDGVHDISVPVGVDFQSMVNQLISGVSGTGYVSLDYSSINTTVPGTYTAVFTSSDGVTKTAKVTVYE